jgi:hypothetical protein
MVNSLLSSHGLSAYPNRYLHELGDYDVSGRVLETAISACEDKNSLLYAELRSTAGSHFFDLNQLRQSQSAWNDSLRIRKRILPDTSPGGKYPAHNPIHC